MVSIALLIWSLRHDGISLPTSACWHGETFLHLELGMISFCSHKDFGDINIDDLLGMAHRTDCAVGAAAFLKQQCCAGYVPL